jgi:hypothetical protein
MADKEEMKEGHSKDEPRSGSLPKGIGHLKELSNDDYAQLSPSMAEAQRKADKEE